MKFASALRRLAAASVAALAAVWVAAVRLGQVSAQEGSTHLYSPA